MRNSTIVAAIMAIMTVMGLAACQQSVAPPQAAAPAPAAKPAPPSKPVAGIQDIMTLEVDASADALWDSVSQVETKTGIKENQPRTDKEWEAVRGRALILIEAANLLMMDDRPVAREGVQKLDDHGTPGNYSAEQSQKAIADNHDTFLSYAVGLRDVGEEMLKAINEKSPQGMMDAGAKMDTVCESCHLKFWYPGQHIPLFPDQAPEVDLPEAAPPKASK